MGESKAEKSPGLDQKQNGGTRSVLRWRAQESSHFQHIDVSGEQDNHEGLFGCVLWCPGCVLRGLEKEIPLTFQRCVILDAK